MITEAERVSAGTVSSGKGHGDENFPVASRLVAAKYRAPILAFYRFARVADDVKGSIQAGNLRGLPPAPG